MNLEEKKNSYFNTIISSVFLLFLIQEDEIAILELLESSM